MRLLEQVAVAMQDQRTGLAGNMISENKLNDIRVSQPWAVTADLIEMLRKPNFMLAYLGDHQYGFVHRTFLEYFLWHETRRIPPGKNNDIHN